MPGADTWVLVEHCCRGCLGRVIQREATFRCADCGAAAARRPDGICGCGLLPDAMRARSGRSSDIFRCGPNPRRTPENPAEIVILFGDAPAVPVGSVP